MPSPAALCCTNASNSSLTSAACFMNGSSGPPVTCTNAHLNAASFLPYPHLILFRPGTVTTPPIEPRVGDHANGEPLLHCAAVLVLFLARPEAGGLPQSRHGISSHLLKYASMCIPIHPLLFEVHLPPSSCDWTGRCWLDNLDVLACLSCSQSPHLCHPTCRGISSLSACRCVCRWLRQAQDTNPGVLRQGAR